MVKRKCELCKSQVSTRLVKSISIDNSFDDGTSSRSLDSSILGDHLLEKCVLDDTFDDEYEEMGRSDRRVIQIMEEGNFDEVNCKLSSMEDDNFDVDGDGFMSQRPLGIICGKKIYSPYQLLREKYNIQLKNDREAKAKSLLLDKSAKEEEESEELNRRSTIILPPICYSMWIDKTKAMFIRLSQQQKIETVEILLNSLSSSTSLTFADMNENEKIIDKFLNIVRKNRYNDPIKRLPLTIVSNLLEYVPVETLVTLSSLNRYWNQLINGDFCGEIWRRHCKTLRIHPTLLTFVDGHGKDEKDYRHLYVYAHEFISEINRIELSSFFRYLRKKKKMKVVSNMCRRNRLRRKYNLPKSIELKRKHIQKEIVTFDYDVSSNFVVVGTSDDVVEIYDGNRLSTDEEKICPSISIDKQITALQINALRLPEHRTINDGGRMITTAAINCLRAGTGKCYHSPLVRGTVAIGCEDGHILIYSVPNISVLCEYIATKSRIESLKMCIFDELANLECGNTGVICGGGILISSASDFEICVWPLPSLPLHSSFCYNCMNDHYRMKAAVNKYCSVESYVANEKKNLKGRRFQRKKRIEAHHERDLFESFVSKQYDNFISPSTSDESLMNDQLIEQCNKSTDEIERIPSMNNISSSHHQIVSQYDNDDTFDDYEEREAVLNIDDDIDDDNDDDDEDNIENDDHQYNNDSNEIEDDEEDANEIESDEEDTNEIENNDDNDEEEDDTNDNDDSGGNDDDNDDYESIINHRDEILIDDEEFHNDEYEEDRNEDQINHQAEEEEEVADVEAFHQEFNGEDLNEFENDQMREDGNRRQVVLTTPALRIVPCCVNDEKENFRIHIGDHINMQALVLKFQKVPFKTNLTNLKESKVPYFQSFSNENYKFKTDALIVEWIVVTMCDGISLVHHLKATLIPTARYYLMQAIPNGIEQIALQFNKVFQSPSVQSVAINECYRFEYLGSKELIPNLVFELLFYHPTFHLTADRHQINRALANSSEHYSLDRHQMMVDVKYICNCFVTKSLSLKPKKLTQNNSHYPTTQQIESTSNRLENDFDSMYVHSIYIIDEQFNIHLMTTKQINLSIVGNCTKTIRTLSLSNYVVPFMHAVACGERYTVLLVVSTLFEDDLIMIYDLYADKIAFILRQPTDVFSTLRPRQFRIVDYRWLDGLFPLTTNFMEFNRLLFIYFYTRHSHLSFRQFVQL
ncbi:hypothetical protein SNEBB_008467 [Seison nebaliae]|nr:hypothetical protein SNEBB_008467 [Seison nebaliae]